MRTPIRFKAETKYTESAEKKANTNLPIMARVGDGGGVIDAVVGRPGWYHIRLVNDANRLTQCRSESVSLSYDDWIYVAKAKDRKLTYYEFVAFIQDAGGGVAPPVCPKFAQVVYVSANACHYATLGAAVAYIKGLPAGSAPAAGREFMIEIQAGTYTETGNIDFPAATAITHTHIRGQGEATIVNMAGFELTLNDDCSAESLIVTGSGAGSGQLVLITGDRVVCRELRVRLTAANDCVEINGAADVELYHVVLETTTIGTVGFYITNSNTVLMWDCKVDDSTNFWPALLIGHSANPSAVITKYCTFRAAAGNNDVWVDANCTWRHLACTVDAQNLSINAAAIVTALEITPVNLDGWADALILDADGDTTISAPTDDQIDFEISGADDFTMTANAFNVLAGSAIVMADGTTIGQVAGPLLTFDDTLNYLEITGCSVGLGTATPDRLFHAEVVDAVTNAITYAQRLSHTVSAGAPAALYGTGLEMELEDAANNMQVASELVTLWAASTSGAESPLFRGTTYPIAVAGPGYWGFWTWTAIDAAGVTVIPNGAGDVPSGLTAVYRLSESGGGTTGGLVTVSNNNSVVLYNDGVDVCTLTVAAAGNVTIARSAGAATFDISILLVWL